MLRQLFISFLLAFAVVFLSTCQKDNPEKLILNDVWESEFFTVIDPPNLEGFKNYFIMNPDSTGLYYHPKTSSCYEVLDFSITNGIVLLDGSHYSYYWSDSLRFTMQLLDTVDVVGYPFPLNFQPIGMKTIYVCD